MSDQIKLFNYFIAGAIAIECLIVAFIFWRFWKKSKDTFFLFFSLSFAILGIERSLLSLAYGLTEASPGVYLIRLAAFSLIIFAIVNKNRQA